MIKETIATNLEQLKNVLNQISDTQFTRKLPVLSTSTLGMHIRHIIEFYQCLLEARQTKTVDYDARKRNIELETQPLKCITAINDIISAVEENNRDFSMNLKANYAMDNQDGSITLQTTFYRELLYNIEHTVHHMAIIKIGLKALQDHHITIDDNFGVAVSTIRNKTVCAQ